MRLAFLCFGIAKANLNPFAATFSNDKNEQGRQTWDPETGAITEQDTSREFGALAPGYWCDQVIEDPSAPGQGVLTLDHPSFRHRRSLQYATNISSSVDRIVGGENVKPNAWRWVGYFYGCGATLVAADWAITAAHCCTIPAWYFREQPLCFGRDERLTESDHEQCSIISEIVQHPNYDRSETVLNDICMLRLTDKLDYNIAVQPVCLPRQNESLETVRPGTVGNQDGQNNNCFVAGWGYRQENIYSSLPDLLQDAKINILQNSTCDEAYREVLPSGREINYFRSTEMSCAGHLEGKVDACQGDSGGPMVCIEESRTNPGHFNPVLRGVVSWGEGCARKGKPGVYARVSNYVDWVHETIKTRAHTTGDNFCGDPKDKYNISNKTDIYFDCSVSECKTMCTKPNHQPNMKTAVCDFTKKEFTHRHKFKPVDCAPIVPGSWFFTPCGALTTRYKIDLDNIIVKCSGQKCVLKGKGPALEPAVSLIKCSRNKYTYPEDRVDAWPKGSVTKQCGPFYKQFPKALEMGIVVDCAPNGHCHLTGPPGQSFNIKPYKKIICQRRNWKFRRNIIKNEPNWKVQSFHDFNENDIGVKSLSMCGTVSIWEYVKDFASEEFMNSGAKALCTPDSKGKNTECHFYCPPDGDKVAVEIKQKFKCSNAKKKWSPGMTAGVGMRLKC